VSTIASKSVVAIARRGMAVIIVQLPWAGSNPAA
jgi:hypothetical protein